MLDLLSVCIDLALYLFPHVTPTAQLTACTSAADHRLQVKVCQFLEAAWDVAPRRRRLVTVVCLIVVSSQEHGLVHLLSW